MVESEARVHHSPLSIEPDGDSQIKEEYQGLRRLGIYSSIYIGIFNSVLLVYSTALNIAGWQAKFKDVTKDTGYNSRQPNNDTPRGVQQCVGVVANGERSWVSYGSLSEYVLQITDWTGIAPNVCCANGIAKTYAVCSFGGRADVMGILAMFCLLWAILWFASLTSSARYATNDFRFYVSIEATKKTVLSKTLGTLLVMFTIGVGAYAYSFGPGTAGAMNLCINIILNILMILPNMSSSYRSISKESASQLPRTLMRVALKPTLTNMWGALVTPTAVFKRVEVGVHHQFTTGDSSELALLGDPLQLKSAYLLLISSSNGADGAAGEDDEVKTLQLIEKYSSDEATFFYRKLLSLLPLVLGIFNSISMALSLSTLRAMETPQIDFEPTAAQSEENKAERGQPDRGSVDIIPGLAQQEPYLFWYGDDSHDSFACYEGVSGISITCDGSANTALFLVCVAVSVILWGTIIVIDLYQTYGLEGNDLRYYLSVERNKSLLVTRIFTYMVMIFTLFLMIYSVKESFQMARAGMAYEESAVHIMIALMSTIVVYQRLVPVLDSYFLDLEKINIIKEFPTPIPIKFLAKKSLGNLYGTLQSADEVFDTIMNALTDSYNTRRDENLAAVIDEKYSKDVDKETLLAEVRKVISEMSGHRH